MKSLEPYLATVIDMTVIIHYLKLDGIKYCKIIHCRECSAEATD